MLRIDTYATNRLIWQYIYSVLWHRRYDVKEARIYTTKYIVLNLFGGSSLFSFLMVYSLHHNILTTLQSTPVMTNGLFTRSYRIHPATTSIQCHETHDHFITYAIFDWQIFRKKNIVYPFVIIHMEHIDMLDFDDKPDRIWCFPLETWGLFSTALAHNISARENG